MLGNTCPGCGKERTKTIGTCPHCGKKWKGDENQPLQGVNRQPQSQPGSGGFSPSFVVIIVILLLGVLTFKVIDYFKIRDQKQFVECQNCCKTIGEAIESYSCDNAGHYPSEMSSLVPDYLKEIPTCPVAGKDTYSKSFHMEHCPDSYTFYCSGGNHPNIIKGDYPQYNSSQGLVTGP